MTARPYDRVIVKGERQIESDAWVPSVSRASVSSERTYVHNDPSIGTQHEADAVSAELLAKIMGERPDTKSQES